MIANPVTVFRNYPSDTISIGLCLGALVYTGSLVGAGIMLLAVAVVFGMVVSRERTLRRQVAEGTKVEPVMSDTERKRIGVILVSAGVFSIGLMEAYWYAAAFIPQSQYGGIVVSSPLAWAIANVSAAVAALVAYRRAPENVRTAFVVLCAPCVLGMLLISTVIPVLLAR